VHIKNGSKSKIVSNLCDSANGKKTHCQLTPDIQQRHGALRYAVVMGK
jgi:hypothetical protein